MSLYLRLKVKDLLTNVELLGWSIGFMEFWVAMWIFVFSGSQAVGEWGVYVVKIDVALAYSFLGLLSISTAAIGLTYSIFHMSRAARYIVKFTKIGPLRLVMEDFLGSLTAILVYAAVIFSSVIGLSYLKWRVLALPENPLGVLIDLILAGVSYYWLSYTLALLVLVSGRTRALTMTSYLPLIIGFLAYSQLWVDLGDLIYVAPLCALPALLTYHGTGAIPPTGSYLAWLTGTTTLRAVNLRLAAISTFAWIAVFIAASLALMRRSRGVPLEEIRL
ncbi:MAG: hypothetical protein DRJ96_01100 [Thermoprotei archaeon]|nr:MAG: hypothetical protein DRJ67_02290 [Thermoprotei archaeon]RLE98405.1 MAG: hypothetical protein DRJ96_01100 [Thermoprotei archaeon]